MEPRIIHESGKTLVGIRLEMSLSQNRMGELWSSFMPRRNEILNQVSDDLYSVAVYKPFYFSEFNPQNRFERWAAVEVTSHEDVPNELEVFNLPGGDYAVFDYKGNSGDPTIFQTIYGSWIPESDYILDDRPHFEVLGEKYKNNDPTSEEEIWIPITKEAK